MSEDHSEAAGPTTPQTKVDWRKAGVGCSLLLGILFGALALIFVFLWAVWHPIVRRVPLTIAGMFVLPCLLAISSRVSGFSELAKRARSSMTYGEISLLQAVVFVLQSPLIISGVAWVWAIRELSGDKPAGGILPWVKTNLGKLISWGLAPNVVLAYVFVHTNHPRLGLIYAASLALSSLRGPFFGLGLKNGRLLFFDKEQQHISSPSYVLACALIFALAFGCIHFAIATLDSAQYNSLHSWQDAVYFSIITMATVGYGDITPLGHLARWAAATEIVCGFSLLVLVLNASLTVWIQQHQNTSSESTAVEVQVKPALEGQSSTDAEP